MDTLTPDTYLAHSDLPDETPIWRYMDFTKLLSMIESGALWFPAMWKFDDAFEGVLSRPFLQRRLMDTELPHPVPPEERKKYIDISYQFGVGSIRTTTFVSCWNVAKGESVALWKIYSQDEIAVQSTIGKVRDAMTYRGVSPMETGLVTYQDDPENEDDERKWPRAVLTKSRMYDYEKEFRFFFSDPEQLMKIFNREQPTEGHSVPIDLQSMIERIVVSPNQPGWFSPLLRRLLSKFELDPGLVQPSDLSRKPFYRQGG